MIVLKLGGELVETPESLRSIARGIARTAERHPLVVVHGGGREIDTELARVGLRKRAVDGLRITDAATLDVVIGVLAGRVNTRLVAAVAGAGARPVGLTGADGRIGLVEPAPPYQAADGRQVELGLVGHPTAAGAPRLLEDLCRSGYTPIVASIGVTRNGRLLNVNADALAAHVAANLGAARLILAGTMPGVIDEAGRVVARLDVAAIGRLVATGSVNAGMVAKLNACRAACQGGVGAVLIADGRHATDLDAMRGTVITIAAGGGNGSRVPATDGRQQEYQS